MRKFTSLQLIEFLIAVDNQLSSPQRIMVLGGGALALAHDDCYRTNDIDLWNTPSDELLRACEVARNETGLRVELKRSTVSDVPYDAEDRVIQILPDMHFLEVLVFDVYDVALSKTIRGYEKDNDALIALHKRSPLDQEILVERYLTEMGHVVGNLRAIDQRFLVLISYLYGDDVAEEVGRRLPNRDPPFGRDHGRYLKKS
jgi:uncharacterized nucleotidyltransferase DUF6036